MAGTTKENINRHQKCSTLPHVKKIKLKGTSQMVINLYPEQSNTHKTC